MAHHPECHFLFSRHVSYPLDKTRTACYPFQQFQRALTRTLCLQFRSQEVALGLECHKNKQDCPLVPSAGAKNLCKGAVELLLVHEDSKKKVTFECFNHPQQSPIRYNCYITCDKPQPMSQNPEGFQVQPMSKMVIRALCGAGEPVVITKHGQCQRHEVASAGDLHPKIVGISSIFIPKNVGENETWGATDLSLFMTILSTKHPSLWGIRF